ncbi:kinase-like protein [Cristinia sonorae]|uniref:Kinase-like protein n=1 Tax=Cristinia sonorae TaxID=1940300 RepID=A0A8K0URT2_9AGAR|nr:kinase-like protein [Cristinia sonorae]
MLAAPAVDISFDDDDWIAPQSSPKLYRAASVGNSWRVTSIGRGFDWDQDEQDHSTNPPRHVDPPPVLSHKDTLPLPSLQRTRHVWHSAPVVQKGKTITSSPVAACSSLPGGSKASSSGSFVSSSVPRSPVHSRPSSPRPVPTTNGLTGNSLSSSRASLMMSTPSSPVSGRSSPVPRPRRRSSQQRVSLIAGRVSILPIEPPSPPPTAPQKLVRANSAASFLSAASSAGPPTPNEEDFSPNAERSISEFVIEREIGRGAYGLVKRAREMNLDGTLGPPLVIKQIIKSRILADCWKRHPKFGTIPIEIYVMSAISSTSYVLPARRPWDPSRFDPQPNSDWVEGKIVQGHPNICPLIDFFEDNHYYYLILPSTTPEPLPDQPPPPSDLFDLVESYPGGLPPPLIRSYLGQIADAMCFLHAKGIVHRDIKDENVVLGPAGKCVLIDFGSSGLVKKKGWDTFSGTLDYAGPEILRGERYQGKEQDVWAFGVVAYVMLVGECPFTTAAEAQEGLESPFSNASMALDERCLECKDGEGQEADGGGALADAAELVRACLQVEVSARPTFEKILQCRFLSGHAGWGSG